MSTQSETEGETHMSVKDAWEGLIHVPVPSSDSHNFRGEESFLLSANFASDFVRFSAVPARPVTESELAAWTSEKHEGSSQEVDLSTVVSVENTDGSQSLVKPSVDSRASKSQWLGNAEIRLTEDYLHLRLEWPGFAKVDFPLDHEQSTKFPPYSPLSGEYRDDALGLYREGELGSASVVLDPELESMLPYLCSRAKERRSRRATRKQETANQTKDFIEFWKQHPDDPIFDQLSEDWHAVSTHIPHADQTSPSVLSAAYLRGIFVSQGDLPPDVAPTSQELDIISRAFFQDLDACKRPVTESTCDATPLSTVYGTALARTLHTIRKTSQDGTRHQDAERYSELLSNLDLGGSHQTTLKDDYATLIGKDTVLGAIHDHAVTHPREGSCTITPSELHDWWPIGDMEPASEKSQE